MKGKYMAYVGSYSYTGKAKGITVFDVDVEKGQFQYRCEMEDWQHEELLDVLNQEVSSDPAKLAEKNIYYLSQTYLEMTDEAVERKRGRDAAGVREAYQETEEIYGFIQANINSINTSTFVSNA